jgi:pimeloyl-ACP methyl ester carboxylesterase
VRDIRVVSMQARVPRPTFLLVEGKSNTRAQPLRQHLDTQSPVICRRSYPRSSADEELPGDVASRGADGQNIRLSHRLEDIEQNKDLAKTKVKTPILALGSSPDIYEAMKPLCENVHGGVIENCGHYIPEEQPEVLAAKMIEFFSRCTPLSWPPP